MTSRTEERVGSTDPLGVSGPGSRVSVEGGSTAGRSDETRAAEAEVTVAVGGPPPRTRAPAVPARVGRYVIVEQAGSGGMGRVLRAYDPKLRREVALKLLNAGSDAQGAARIVREAQAMARLSHPNLVPVYDVEVSVYDTDIPVQRTHDTSDNVFIVMEYVEGDTLGTWLQRSPRTWQEVLAAFIGAGRGLAAAHAAGVVHRDFKPSNAMVGTDTHGASLIGRVRVMDFGLARGIEADPSIAEPESEFAYGSDLTQAGTVLGTPPYMAPEQHRGRALVPATDQYAFCVALYEALYGVRPFVGVDMAELVRAKLRGVPQLPSGTARSVPHWLRVATIRGLAVDPIERWPTMDLLLATLERGQARARTRQVFAAVGIVAVIGAGVALAYQLDSRARTAACEQAGASIDALWNDDMRARVRAAMVATGVSYAGTAAVNVMPWLDARAAAWQHARTDACLDADLRQVWDQDTLDRSLWCLDEQWLAFESLVGQLASADATVVRKSVGAAASGLASVQVCRDAGLLGLLPRPPVERRDEVRDARADLTQVDAFERAGKYDEGLALAGTSREHAESLGWPPLLAAAHLREAQLYERQGDFVAAEQAGAQAYFEAVECGAWDLAAAAASRLVVVVGARLVRHAEGLTWGQHAEVALKYAADPDDLREATRLSNLASTYHRAGDYAQARALHEQALAIRETALGTDHPDLAPSLNNLANARQSMGDNADALLLYERALAISEKAGGPDHPDVALGIANIALANYENGDFRAALALNERALALREKALGTDHLDVAASLANLGSAHQALRDFATARPLYERALAIWEQALGPDHPDVAATLSNLSISYYHAKDYPPARKLGERALAIFEKSLGPDHPNVASAMVSLASVYSALDEHAKARELETRALAIRERALGADHPLVAVSLVGAARAQVADGDNVAALRLLERALVIYELRDGTQDGELEADYDLAVALDATGGDRTRARALAEQALAGWRSQKINEPDKLAAVESWLASHPRID